MDEEKALRRVVKEVCLRINQDEGHHPTDGLLKMLAAWQEQSAKPVSGEISKEGHGRWHYYYPKYGAAQFWVKAPPQELSDA